MRGGKGWCAGAALEGAAVLSCDSRPEAIGNPITLLGSARDAAAAHGRPGLSYWRVAACGLAVLLLGAL